MWVFFKIGNPCAPPRVGGGTDLLCIPSNKPVANVDKGGGSYYGYIYPVKYAVDSYGANTLTHLDGETAPCSVCEVDNSTDVMTVHGTTSCPEMYVREYYG